VRATRVSGRAPKPGTFKHGATGYRKHSCRCDVCMEGVRIVWKRERDSREARTGRRTSITAARAREGDPPDWTTVAHLVPGYGVRKRNPNG
jgi:hypothetical protein